MPAYALIWLNKQDSEYGFSLNMPKFWIWQGSQYVNVRQCSEYARIWI